MILKQRSNNKTYTYRMFNPLYQHVLIWSCYWIPNANTAFLILFCFRDHHRFDHDHFKHQCPALLAKSVICNRHGLVHSCLLCFRLLCSYWVCSCQLLYQSPDTEGQQDGTDCSLGPCDNIKSNWTLGSWDCFGNCLLFLNVNSH